MLAPILLYGSEVWDFENCDIINAYHFKFCEMMLHLKSSTPKVMVYGELGQFPMTILFNLDWLMFGQRLYLVKRTNWLIDYTNFVLYK